MGKGRGDKIMTKNKMLAEALLDIAKKSTTSIVEVDSDFDLIEAAAKLNIQLPSPDLAVIKTVYAETDKPNRNGIRLPKEAVIAGLPTIIGKQINWEHDGAGRICGYIIDAKLNNDLIEITGVIFKSLFPEEMDEVKAKFEKGDLTVSFEIWNKDPKNGKSVVHDLKDESRSIDPIIFHGCGLLLAHAPACPKAKVYKLVAKKDETIDYKIFDKDLVYASQALEQINKEETIMAEEIKKEETKIEEIVDAKERLCPECKKPLKDDEKELCGECLKKKESASEEPKVEEKPAETKTEEKSEVAETKAEEAKTEEQPVEIKVEEKPVEAKVEEKPAETPAEEKPVEAKAEEAKEEVKEEVPAEEKKEEVAAVAESPIVKKCVSVINEETVITLDSMDGQVVRRGMRRMIRKFDDNTEEVFSEEFAIVDTYTQAQLDEKVAAAKAEKDAEIATIKAEHEVAIKNKDTELASKSQEIAALTVKEESTPKDKILEVGSVETKDKYEGIQAEVNAKAFGKGKKA